MTSEKSEHIHLWHGRVTINTVYKGFGEEIVCLFIVSNFSPFPIKYCQSFEVFSTPPFSLSVVHSKVFLVSVYYLPLPKT